MLREVRAGDAVDQGAVLSWEGLQLPPHVRHKCLRLSLYDKLGNVVSQKQPERCFINLRVDNNKNDERSNQLHYYLEVGGARREEGCVGDVGAGESSKTGRGKSIVFKHCQTVKLRGENLARDDTFKILAFSTPFAFAIFWLSKSGIFLAGELALSA